MNVGDLKLSLLLDIRPFGASVKTALNILSTFNKSAAQSLKFQDPKINISGIDSQLSKLDSTLNKYQSEVTQSVSSNESLSQSFQKTSSVSVTLDSKLQNIFLRFQGVQSVIQILKGTFGAYLAEYNKFQSALLGLESISVFKGIDSQSSQNAVVNLKIVKDGLLSVSDASTSLKNLLASNFTLEQSIELIKRFGDSAAFGRQESLSFGEAIRSATEGLKNGNSITVDNAGVTKNLSLMLEQAGFKAQDLMRASEDAGVRMALFNGIVSETNGQLGNADKLINSSQGGLIKFQKSITDLKIAFGGVISSLTPLITGTLTTLNNFLIAAPDNAKKAALAFVGVATAMVFLNGQLSFLTKGFLLINALVIGLPTPLKILVGGLALIAAGILAVNGQLTIMNIELAGIPALIGLVVTAATALSSAFSDVSTSEIDMNTAIEETNKKITELEASINSLSTVDQALRDGMVLNQIQQKEYNTALETVKSLYPEVVTGIDQKTKSEILNSRALEEAIEKEKEKLRILKGARIETVKGEISDLTETYIEQTDTIEELNGKLKDGAKILKEDFKLWNPNPFKSFESYLRDASSELLATTKAADETRKKIADLFTANLQSNTLTPLLSSLRQSLGESKTAMEILNSSVDSMASNLIDRFKAITTSGKALTSVFKLIALGQNLIKIGQEIGSNEVSARGESILNQIDDKIAEIEAQKQTIVKKSSTTGTRTETNKDVKEFVSTLSKLNSELAEIQTRIASQTEGESITEGLFGKKKDIEDQIALIKQLNEIGVKGVIRKRTMEEITGIKVPGKRIMTAPPPEPPEETKTEEDTQFQETFEQSLSLAQQLSNVLGLGADNFISKLLGGLQEGLSLANSFAKLFSLFMNVGSGGIFSFLGLASGGQVPGSGSGDTVPAMLTPGEFVIKKSVVKRIGNGFFEWLNGGTLFSSLAGRFASGGLVTAAGSGGIQVVVLESRVKGEDIVLSQTRSNNRTGRRTL